LEISSRRHRLEYDIDDGSEDGPVVTFRDAKPDGEMFSEPPTSYSPHWLRELARQALKVQSKPASPIKTASSATKPTRLGEPKRKPSPE
jgi:hypothetical protein